MTGTISGTTRHYRFEVPGSGQILDYRRDTDGRLLELRCGDRVHVLVDGPRRVYGAGVAAAIEQRTDDGLRRTVRTSDGTEWTERYHWDGTGRLSSVDGVAVYRDALGRITSCVDADGTAWRYAYAANDLAVIHPPGRAPRHLTAGPDGRTLLCRVGGRRLRLDYTETGERRGCPPPPANWHHDAFGRRWTVTAPDGTVLATYLWDGLHCLGRIDGPPDAPVDAVFSLDPSGTPVRVVTRGRVIRIPRDAYGERLLAHRGVPGLFGGATHRGLVHLPFRTLDPRLGAFTGPDPFHGGPDDPRRRRGHAGVLPVEPAGARASYVVARHDPVGRTDPTGAISAWLPLADLTWSWQNNVLGTLGFDLTVNFWGSLFTGKLDRFWSFDGAASSDWVGGWGILRDGALGLDRAFTYGHLVFQATEKWDELRRTRVVVPAGRYVPRLQGTLLRIRPDAGPPSVFRGDAILPSVGSLRGWVRSGGDAEAGLPGSPVPWFPRGGLHLDSELTEVTAPQAATLDELGPVGRPVTATMAVGAAITLRGTGFGLSAGSPVALLSDVEVTGGDEVTVLEVDEVTEGEGATTIRLPATPVGPASGVRLRGLVAAGGEQRFQGHNAVCLNAVGATLPYQRDDILWLSRGGAVQGAVHVTGYQARLVLDEALPADLVSPLHLRGTVPPTGMGLSVTLGPNTDQVTLDVGVPAPSTGNVLRVGTAAVPRAAIVTDVTGLVVTVDRDVATAATVGDPETARVLATGGELGTRGGGPETDPLFTYAPAAPGTAPAGVIVVEGTGRRVARTVVGIAWDDVVMGGLLPFPDPATPYDVRRFALTAPDQLVSVTELQTLTTSEPLTTAAPDGATLRVEQYQATDLPGVIANGATPIGAPVTITDTVVGITGSPPDNPPRPGHAVVLTRGGEAPELAVVREVRVRCQFDRNLVGVVTDLDTSGLEATLLNFSGPSYAAARLDTNQVTVLPQVDGSRTQLPRFRVGETVFVSWDRGGGGTPTRDGEYHLVTSVDGTTLEFQFSGPSLPPVGVAAGQGANFTVLRAVPDVTDHGSMRAGLDGVVDPASPRVLDVATWRANKYRDWAATGRQPLAVSDGTHVVPARPTTFIDWEIRLASVPRRLTGKNVQIVLPAPPRAAQISSSFVADGGSTRLAGSQTVTPLPLLAGDLVSVVTAFGPVDGTEIGADLSQGGVRVPETEGAEVDREQSLKDHELTHTMQTAKWGPLLFAWIPVWAFQAVAELATGVERPDYSAYGRGRISSPGSGRRELTITDPAGATYAAGDEVQISQGGPPRVIKLGTATGTDRFWVTDPLEGDVNIRKLNKPVNSDAWFNEGWLSALQSWSHGGIFNMVAGTAWAGLFWAVGQVISALGSLASSGTRYRAKVVDAGTLTLSVDPMDPTAGQEMLNAFLGIERIMITQDSGGVLVRRLLDESPAPGILKLNEPVTCTGEVTVAPYASSGRGSLVPWRKYYPLTVPETDRPAAVKVHPVDGNSLALVVNDRVEVLLGNDNALPTYVTAVGADGAAELRDPVLAHPAGEQQLRIAKISESDPVGWLDSWVMEKLGMGWLRWASDPWGQLTYRTHPDPGSFWGITARVARYLLSTQSWGGVPFGYWFWFSALRQGYLSPMEQEASEDSGDLYSPVGRLHDRPVVVGDVGRYWYHLLPRYGRLQEGFQDTPGVHLQGVPRVMPFRTDETNPGGQPPPLNQGAACPAAATTPSPDSPAEPGGAVPDVFMVKNTVNPAEPTADTPRGFVASAQGSIPVGPATERGMGVYVAFCRGGPDQHRVTIHDFPLPVHSEEDLKADKDAWMEDGAVAARAAHDASAQKVFFDLTVADVAVTLAGITVLEGRTVELVQTQRARLAVTTPPRPPGTVREHMLTTTRPRRDPVLRTDPAGSVLIAQNANTTAREPVEVSRVYRGDLNGWRVHLGGEIHVPVRSFWVTVTDTLAARSSATIDPADPSRNVITTARQGDTVFVLVPAEVCVPLAVTLPATYPDSTAMDLTPTVTDVTVSSAETRDYLGEGGQAFQITFDSEQNPHMDVDVPMQVHTWISRADRDCTSADIVSATLSATVTLRRS